MKTSNTFTTRLLAGIGLLALLAAIGLVTSRPAHSGGGPVPVTVVNAVTNHDGDNPALQPFAIRVFPTPKASVTFTVPTGKRLVIQQVSAFSFGSTTVEDVELFSVLAGKASTLRIPFTVNNHGIVYATQSLTHYADAGKVEVKVDDTDVNDTRGLNIDITGYFVDVP